MGFVKHIPEFEFVQKKEKEEPIKKNTGFVIISGDMIHSYFGVEVVTMEN